MALVVFCCVFSLFASALHTKDHSHSREQLDWKEYRIGDGVKFYEGAPGCSEFPRSIVCEYQKRTNLSNDVSTLMKVLSAFDAERPDDRTVVVHLRLGDGLCARYDTPCRGTRIDTPSCWDRDSDCWIDKSISRQYAYSKHWYSHILEEIPANYTHVVIVSDKYHWTRITDPRNGDFSVDDHYRERAEQFFAAGGYKIVPRQPKLPDEDFAFMCGAHVFIRGGGGLSELISQVVSQKGGKILTPMRNEGI